MHAPTQTHADASRQLRNSGCWLALLGAVCGALGCQSPVTERGAVAPQVPLVILPSPQPMQSRPTLSWQVAPEVTDDPRAAIRQLFEAVGHESNDQLSEVLVDDAVFHRPNKDPASALLVWVRRFAALDYTQGNARSMASNAGIQLIDAQAYSALRPFRDLKLQPRQGEYLAVVPLGGITPDKLWGSQLQVVLTRDHGTWKARSMWEDYAQF